MVSSFCN